MERGFNPKYVAVNIQTLSVLLFKQGVISFRAVPRVLSIVLGSLGYAFHQYHFTSVINWSLKAGLYKLNNIAPWVESWTAIVDTSIEWGNKKMLVVLRAPNMIMNNREEALTFNDVEVVGLYVKETINGEVIADLLKPLFSTLGNPSQLLTDGGSDIARGIQLVSESTASTIPHTLDIGHFAANILKRHYVENDTFKELVSFTSKVGAKLRQTVAAWIVPNKVRAKARFQSISRLSKWVQKAFEYCKKHLDECDEKTRELLVENFEKNEKLVSFSEKFYQDCQAINKIHKIVKNKGLSKATYSESMSILSTLPLSTEIRPQLENYLESNLRTLTERGISTGLASTDIIESVFGKIKYIIERSSTKDFNRLCLLLPILVGELDEKLIAKAQEEVKIQDVKAWEEANIGTTILKQKRLEFRKLEPKKAVPHLADTPLAQVA